MIIPRTLFLITFLFPITRLEAASPNEYFRVAKFNYDKAQYSKALDFISLAIEEDSTYVNAYFLRAQILFEIEQFQGVIDDLDLAMSLNPDNSLFFSDYYHLRGKAHQKLNQYALAIDDMNHSLEIRGDNSDALYTRAILSKQLGDLRKAMTDLDRAIQLKSDNGIYYATRARIRNELYKPVVTSSLYQNILADIEVAIALEPENFGFHMYRNSVLSRIMNSEQMLIELQQLIGLFPDKGELYAQIGYLHIQNFEFSKAIPPLNKAITLDPEDEKSYRMRGLSYHNMNKLALAIKDYNISIEMLIRQYQDNKDKKELLKTLAETFNLRAFTYVRKGELQEACQDYSASAKLGSKKGYNNFCKNCNVYSLTR